MESENLESGNSLYIYKLNTKTGEYTMVDAKTCKVTDAGNVSVSMSKKATYELVDSAKAATIDKEIKATIQPKKSGTVTVRAKVTLKNGSKKTIKMTVKVKK